MLFLLYLYFQQNDKNYPGSAVGHFTSVVWYDVTEVGAAIYHCPIDEWPPHRPYLAFCSPGSNMMGDQGNNVKCPKDTKGLNGSLACNNC